MASYISRIRKIAPADRAEIRMATTTFLFGAARTPQIEKVPVDQKTMTTNCGFDTINEPCSNINQRVWPRFTAQDELETVTRTVHCCSELTVGFGRTSVRRERNSDCIEWIPRGDWTGTVPAPRGGLAKRVTSVYRFRLRHSQQGSAEWWRMRCLLAPGKYRFSTQSCHSALFNPCTVTAEVSRRRGRIVVL
jgi:hypothetical protein